MFRTTKTKVFSAVAAPAIVAAIVIGAAGAWLHGASPVFAPEPARLTSTLYGSGASSAMYVTTLKPTSAYFLSSSWTWSSLPAGYPCSTTYPRPSGVTVYSTIQASGNYRKCV